MRRITAIENVTLDGVMQAPGRPDEDTRGGFAHGGWAGGYADEVSMGFVAEDMHRPGGLLFGRRTYELVVTRGGAADPAYPNTELLVGEATETVAARKAQGGEDLTILGSGELSRRSSRTSPCG